MSTARMWLKNLEPLCERDPEGVAIWRTFATMLRFVENEKLSGSGHPVSAVLHILLRVQRIESVLVLGVVGDGDNVFNHSWVEAKGQAYDAAGPGTLVSALSLPPVFRGLDLATMATTELRYGVQSCQEYDPATRAIAQVPIARYMDTFPFHPGGLIEVAAYLARATGLSVGAAALRSAAEQSAWSEHV
jgi:hypothetical protein